jgi:hypothetical protein
MGRMVEMFPNLLSLDTDAQIMPVLYFLQVTPLKLSLKLWLVLVSARTPPGESCSTRWRPLSFRLKRNER